MTEPAPPGAKRGRLVFPLAVAAIAAIGATFRIVQWADLDPYSDQAFQIHWVRQVVDAGSVLPISAEGTDFLAALERGGDNLLYAYGSKVIASNESIFVTVALAWHAFLGALFGASATVQAAIGIAIHWVMLVVLALLAPLAAPHVPIERRWIAGPAAFAVAAGSAALQIVSTIGFHNTGLACLLLAVLATQRWLNAKSDGTHGRGPWFFMIASQALALYAYFTNLMFLPFATGLALLARWYIHREGLADVWGYALSLAAILAPAVLLVAVSAILGFGGIAGQGYGGGLALVFTADGNPATAIAVRMGAWFVHIVDLFSVPGFILGIAGLLAAAVRWRMMLPLCVVVAHWLANAFVPIFDQMHSRTGAYVLPFLAFGIGVLAGEAVASIRRGAWAWKGVTACLVALLGLHAWIEAPAWIAAQKGPWFLEDRSARGFRRGAETLDRTAPRDALVIPANYQVAYYISALSTRAGRDLVLFRPLDVLADRARDGELEAYAEKRGLRLPRNAPLLLVTVWNADVGKLVGQLNRVLADPTFGHPTPVVVRTPLRGAEGGALVFHAVEPATR